MKKDNKQFDTITKKSNLIEEEEDIKDNEDDSLWRIKPRKTDKKVSKTKSKSSIYNKSKKGKENKSKALNHNTTSYCKKNKNQLSIEMMKLEDISKEINKTIKELEKGNHRELSKDTSCLNQKRHRSKSSNLLHQIEYNKTKTTAKDFNFHIDPNYNIKHIDIIDLFGPVDSNADILLSILELGHNPLYYRIAFQNNTKAFWQEALRYIEIQKRFKQFCAEELRSYWIRMSSFNIETILKIIKDNRELINDQSITLNTLIQLFTSYFDGHIADIGKYLNGQAYPNLEIDDNGNSNSNNKGHCNINEVTISPIAQTTSSNNNNKDHINEEEKKRIMELTENDSYFLKSIDDIANEFVIKFTKYSKDYITQLIIANSFNIAKTYLMLRENYEDERSKLKDSIDRACLKNIIAKRKSSLH